MQYWKIVSLSILPERFFKHIIFLNLTIMESCIARCLFFITNEMQLMQCFFYYQRFSCFGRYFRPSSEAYKTVCAAFGIVMLSCSILLLWMGWSCSNPLTPTIDIRKEWQYPRLHIQFYKLLMMGGNTTRNM